MTWARLPIKRLGDVFLGKMIQSEPKSESDVAAPYLRAAHVQPNGQIIDVDDKTMWFSERELRLHDLRADDVVIVEGGAGYGRSAVVRTERMGWGFQNSIVRVRPRPLKATGRFLDYALQAALAAGEIETACFTATIPHFTADKVGAFLVPAPPVREQRAVADYLDRETARIDTLIEEQLRLIELLRERRNVVLSAAFSAGPSTDTTRVGRLLSARPSYGVLVPSYVDETEGVPFVRVGDILNLATERRLLAIAPEQSNEYSRTKISGGEVLLGVVGKMGQAAIAPRWLAGANVARAVAVLRCRDAAVAPLLCAWLGSNDFLRQAELATSGDSIQPTLGMKDLARFDINLPTHPHAAADLAGQMAKFDTLIAETERFIELVGERRSALITAAVTGQIDLQGVA
ncbi:restriction endonuclease subunit S [Kitasatospora sp. NPDC001660]